MFLSKFLTNLEKMNFDSGSITLKTNVYLRKYIFYGASRLN